MKNTNSNGIKRILKFMFGGTEKNFLISLAFCLGMVLYMFVLSGNYTLDQLMAEVKLLPIFVLWIGSLFMSIFQISYSVLWNDMQLSMGATRKEILVGQICFRALFSVQMLIFGALVYLLVPNEAFSSLGTYLLVDLASLLMVNAVSAFVTLLVDRLGKVAYYIFVAAMALFGGLIGGISAMMSELDSPSRFYGRLDPGQLISVILIGLGTVLLVVAGFVSAKVLKNRAVRV